MIGNTKKHRPNNGDDISHSSLFSSGVSVGVSALRKTELETPESGLDYPSSVFLFLVFLNMAGNSGKQPETPERFSTEEIGLHRPQREEQQMSSTTQHGKHTVEKRLDTARQARDRRQQDGAIPTVADVLLGTLDTLPDLPAQLAQIKAWATDEVPRGNLCCYLRQGVAQGWLTGPKADPFKRRMAA